MTTTLIPSHTPTDSGDEPASPATGPHGRELWLNAAGAGAAVLLVGTAVSTIVQGVSWAGYAALAVVLVVGVGVALHRAHPAVVPLAQVLGLLVLTCALFSDNTLLVVLPTPTAIGDIQVLVSGAGAQINTGVPPVPATPEVLLLVTAAFGVLTIAMYAVAVLARAPAAAAVPLLAVFAVPVALANELLPAWVLAAAAAGFLILLTAHDGMRQRLPGATAITAIALGLALLAGAAAQAIGTAGRFGDNAGNTGPGGVIGLSPFTALRGQLERTEPLELFEVSGLPRAAYLRALTLSDYVPDLGWQPTRPDPGVPLTSRLPVNAAPGEEVEITVTNHAFRDYWLPVYGVPLTVSGVPEGVWSFDPTAGIAYSSRPRQEDSWTQWARFVEPSAAQLRAARDNSGVPATYLDVEGVDPRVIEIALQITAGRTTGFDRAMALLDHFTGPGSTFRYDLRTAPGNGDDALVEFLTVGRAGYCEQFASAMAVMLRTVGVPARVAVGFTAGTESGDHRTVTTADAHAWVEAWFAGVGWVVFDPTPLTDGRSVIPPYVAQARAETATEEEIPAEPDDPLTDPGDELDLGSEISPPEQSPQPPEPTPPAATDNAVPLWPLAVLVPIAAACLAPAGLRGLRRRRRLAAVDAGGTQAADAAWAELLAESIDRGVSTAPTDTVRSAARRLVHEHQLDDQAQQALRTVVRAVERAWYGGSDIEPGELTEAVNEVRQAIAAGSPLTIRDRLFPRSLWVRSTRAQRDDEEAAHVS